MKVVLLLDDKIIQRYNKVNKIYIRKDKLIIGQKTISEKGESYNTILVPYDFTKVKGYSIEIYDNNTLVQL